MRQYWTAPEQWPGATVVCVAGGPSLTQAQVDACRERELDGSRVRVIVINDGYRVAPWADVLYFCDDRWWEWHAKKVGAWAGLIVRLDGGKYDFGDKRIKVMRNDSHDGDRQVGGLADRRDALRTGRNSGFQAINLAVHLGAKRIVLLGYDMQPRLEGGRTKMHWFGDHPGGTSDRVFDTMLPHFQTLVDPLRRRGVEVLNATPGSRISCFPKVSIEQVLGVVQAA